MSKFELKSPWPPTGDQPVAIKKLISGLQGNNRFQTLLGVTGSGKTFTMASVVEKINKPTLVIAHNKTLAAQLASEFREFFPKNAVEYFVSYYDYYQPEAYIPQMDLYIEKDSDINEEIDRLRLAATKSLLTRKDVIIVASVSCIYNIGSPESYAQSTVTLTKNDEIDLKEIKSKLVRMQYDRNDLELKRSTFRVKGEVVEIHPSYEEFPIQILLSGSTIEKIYRIHPTTKEKIEELSSTVIFAARHYNAPVDIGSAPFDQIKKELVEFSRQLKKENKLVENQRINDRVNYDLEMMQELGFVKGIENYSRYFDKRLPGEPPFTLLDYFPSDFLTFIDESHMTIPQIRAMWHGERKRKETLIENGFRLPSALDNRPLTFDEFLQKENQVIFVSATPGDYEKTVSKAIVEQIIRPTGIIDPAIEIRTSKGQIDDLISEIQILVQNGQRVLVTTLTTQMSEDLSEYLQEKNIKVMYIHFKIDTLERVDILRDLRKGKYDVLIGINLLREGLDLPEVSLVAILDADKEGFLRSKTALIQTIGRAARHIEGKVIMYADQVTKSMKEAIDETNRRRKIQEDYNSRHHITPESIQKAINDIGDRLKELQPEIQAKSDFDVDKIPKTDLKKFIRELKEEMVKAADAQDFERAALLRDQMLELQNYNLEIPKTVSPKEAKKIKF